MTFLLSKERRTITRRKISQFWDEYKRKKVGILGLVMLLLFIFAAIFGPYLTPYDPIVKTRVARAFAMPEWVTVFPQFQDLAKTKDSLLAWEVQQGSQYVKGWGSTTTIEWQATTMTSTSIIVSSIVSHQAIPPHEFFVRFSWASSEVQNTEYSLRLTISDPNGKEYLLYTAPNSRKSTGEVVQVESNNPFVIMKLGLDPGTDNIANIIFSQKGDYTLRIKINMQPLSSDAKTNFEIKNSEVWIAGDVHGVLGTDYVGADVFSDLLYGTRISLIIGLLAAVVGTVIGVLVGIASGYLGGIVDEITMRIVDILICLPLLPLLLALVSIYGKSIFYIVVFIGIFGWQGLARVIRSQALSVREMVFVDSARASGASSFYIMIKHIVPNVLPVAFASLVLAVPGAILFEASLSFLGFGDPRVPTWGKMLQYSFSFGGFTRLAWWWILPPGLAIIALCLTFVFIGHAFDEVVNPRLRRRQ
jgi:peptide/nickel transport system permease protein